MSDFALGMSERGREGRGIRRASVDSLVACVALRLLKIGAGPAAAKYSLSDRRDRNNLDADQQSSRVYCAGAGTVQKNENRENEEGHPSSRVNRR